MDKEIWCNEDWIKVLQTVIVLIFIFIVAGYETECVLAITDRELDYHETNFNTTNWFNVLQEVILNTTTNKLYLNGTIVEYNDDIDCTTFTKVGTHTTVIASQVRHQYDSLNDNDWVYSDYGVGYWTHDKNLELNYTILNSDNNAYRWSCLISLSNNLIAWSDDNNRQIVLVSHWGNVEYNMYLAVGERDSGAWTNWDGNGVTTNLVRDTDYYCTFYLNSTHVVNDVYSDSARTIRIRHLYMLLDDDAYSYRYLFIARSANTGTGGDGSICDTYGKNYEIRYYTSGIEPLGYAYTKNLLENETDISFSSLVNATIGTGCNLKVYFSDDNITWVERLYLTTTGTDYTRLENLNYTSLYAKFKLSSNGVNNVEVLNFFYTNLLDALPPSTSTNNDWVMAILFILVPLILVLVYAFKRSRG